MPGPAAAAIVAPLAAHVGTAKSVTYVAKSVTDAINAAAAADSGTSQTSPLTTLMKKQVAARTVYSYGVVEDYTDTKFATSPMVSLLIRASKTSLIADSTSRILYAPPSSGKTSACKSFMKKVLGEDGVNSPGMLFTGGTAIADYFDFIASCFPGYEKEPHVVFKCLVAALSRADTATQSSPWLILDEFNLAGEERINLVFAENLFRQVAEKNLNFNILFVTQKIEMAQTLLAMNAWQKISPLSGSTIPDSATIVRAEMAPKEEDVKWPEIVWTRRQLSCVVFLRFPDLEKEESLLELKNGKTVLKEVKRNMTPTAALKVGGILMTKLKKQDLISGPLATLEGLEDADVGDF
jgi:hypothetical protein